MKACTWASTSNKFETSLILEFEYEQALGSQIRNSWIHLKSSPSYRKHLKLKAVCECIEKGTNEKEEYENRNTWTFYWLSLIFFWILIFFLLFEIFCVRIFFFFFCMDGHPQSNVNKGFELKLEWMKTDWNLELNLIKKIFGHRSLLDLLQTVRMQPFHGTIQVIVAIIVCCNTKQY